MLKQGEQLSKMLVLAVTRHAGQYDKAGKPYILHTLAVMHKLRTDDEELNCIAVGHDLVEDTGTTFAELKELGFTDRVIEGIRNLTKFPGETYEEYMERVKSSPDSIRVKLCDLQHNSDIRRLKGLTEKDFKRLQKYNRMYLELKEALNSY
jgi:(p)ppGpp synthase/HD superfamily hydrolase